MDIGTWQVAWRADQSKVPHLFRPRTGTFTYSFSSICFHGSDGLSQSSFQGSGDRHKVSVSGTGRSALNHIRSSSTPS